MNPIFLADLPTFAETVRMALRLDPDIYVLVQNSEEGLVVSLAVVLLAALSEALGQSVVLFLNRVRPRRYPLALGIAGASNVIGFLLWSVVIWLTVWLLFGERTTLVATLSVVGLSYAPQLLAFFELAPYFGNFVALVLSLWSMAAIIVAIWAGMELAIWQAAFTGLSTWAAIQVWRRSLGRPIYAVGRMIERGASGNALVYSVDDAMEGRLKREQFSQNWKLWLQQQREALRVRSIRARKEGPRRE